MKYYLIAGEASGDLHGSNLVKAILSIDPKAEFRAWGGDLMQAAGCVLVKHISELAFMGFKEVVTNLPAILKNIRLCKQDMLAWRPDVVVLIDYPGFNLRMAAFAKKNGLKVAYYISPQLWAWKAGRVTQVKQNVDLMLCILPFEKAFYDKHQCPVEYVGHPLLDAIASFQPDPSFYARHHLSNQPIVALLPGSRQQEIEKMLPIMAKVQHYLISFNLW